MTADERKELTALVAYMVDDDQSLVFMRLDNERGPDAAYELRNELVEAARELLVWAAQSDSLFLDAGKHTSIGQWRALARKAVQHG